MYEVQRMTIIRSTKLYRTAYRQRNRSKIRAKEQTRRDNARGGPRMCARCQLAPAATSRHRYCEECKAVAEREKPRSLWPRDDRPAAERGYDAVHRKTRVQWSRIIDAGNGYCCRCGAHIPPGSAWHLDHTDDRQGYLGPSHTRCNVSAAARKGSAIAKAFDPRVPPAPTGDHSRVWL
jgi:hypothetical protein